MEGGGGGGGGGRHVIVFARGSGGAIRLIKLISRTNKGREEERGSEKDRGRDGMMIHKRWSDARNH